jgi:hypothetical protein
LSKIAFFQGHTNKNEIKMAPGETKKQRQREKNSDDESQKFWRKKSRKKATAATPILLRVVKCASGFMKSIKIHKTTFSTANRLEAKNVFF